jgi:UDPglucose--hexose-1-phosphate uridylyltransferase
MKPHFRKDIISSNWVIVSDERALRPNDYEYKIRCPFCPGREGKTPPEILSLPHKNKWLIRVVPNKYPAVEYEIEKKNTGEGMYRKEYLKGMHEVVVETPRHNDKIYQIKHYDKVLEVFALRMKKLYEKEDIEYVMIFRNYGIKAGASLKHPHSQIIALPILPLRVKDELEHFTDYLKKYNRCILCDVIKNELETKKRVIDVSHNFIAFTPFASRFNFEVMIAPLKHNPDYYLEENFSELRDLISEIFRKLHRTIFNPSYNLVIHTSPKNAVDFHWHIEILPKLAMPAGFEWGSGFFINSISPEKACEMLKKERRIKIH